MKKIMLMSVAALLLAASCGNDKKQSAIDLQSIAENDSLQGIIAQRDGQINEMLSTMNEIQDGLRQITEAENRVALAKTGEGASSSKQNKETIQFNAESMKKTKEHIAKLKNKLRDTNYKDDELTKTIENLQTQLEEKNQELQQLRAELDAKNIHITELDETINNLNTNVSELKEESAQKTETINNQDVQLNTAWYVFGTKKELKEQRIYANGKVLQGSFNKNYFTKIDIRQDKVIKLYSKSATLLTNHPTGSYTLTQDANKQYVLNITNPEMFWSTSKYLVVQVK